MECQRLGKAALGKMVVNTEVGQEVGSRLVGTVRHREVVVEPAIWHEPQAVQQCWDLDPDIGHTEHCHAQQSD